VQGFADVSDAFVLLHVACARLSAMGIAVTGASRRFQTLSSAAEEVAPAFLGTAAGFVEIYAASSNGLIADHTLRALVIGPVFAVFVDAVTRFLFRTRVNRGVGIVTVGSFAILAVTIPVAVLIRAVRRAFLVTVTSAIVIQSITADFRLARVDVPIVVVAVGTPAVSTHAIPISILVFTISYAYSVTVSFAVVVFAVAADFSGTWMYGAVVVVAIRAITVLAHAIPVAVVIST